MVPKRTSLSSFRMNSCIEMLQNTPKLHFGSNGGNFVCSSEDVRRNFGTPKQCILVPKRTSFSSFCMHCSSKMLQSTPQHHPTPRACDLVCSCENVRRNFGT